MKNKIKIRHTVYPDGVVLHPYTEHKENKNNPFIVLAILLVMFVMIGTLVLIYLI